MLAFASFSVLFVLSLGDGSPAPSRNATLRFYKNSIDNFIELQLNDAHNILSTSWYIPRRDTIIYCFGFTGRPDGRATQSVIQSYLEQAESNVALLNWEHLAAQTQSSLANSYLNSAAPNARQVGIQFADVLMNLSASGLDINRTHLVGHSLGAHIFGIAGNNMAKRGTLLPWITGLDPASVSFEGRSLDSKIHAGSAAFVDIIHTDPNKYGYRRAMGTVDFWPAYRQPGPVRQPGCENGPHPMFSPEDICSHDRSWQLWVDAIRYPESLIGSHARNYRIWKRYSDSERKSVVLPLGRRKTNISTGNYYFNTESKSPFGLGMLGL